ncbi:MAG: hypothetical protein KGQ58_01915 [Proteobacteria bacterium]|nr:hypothetical protein [Pseudomonadota bacterium]MDE3207814.1 hypothetical protein [Pseudomonadota bacterium]
MKKFAALFALMTCVYSYRSFIKGGLTPSFWKLVQRHADVAYDFFRNDSAWQVFIGETPHNIDEMVPSSLWMGPYMLAVPKLRGKQVFIYCRKGRYERSQTELNLALSGLTS